MMFYQMWEFWAIVAAAGFFSFHKKIPFLGKLLPNKNTWIWGGLLFALFTSGMLASAGVFGSANTASLNSGLEGSSISDLQVTTDFTYNGTNTLSESSAVDDLIDLRYYDANVSEVSGDEELYTGIITVTRVGSLAPSSCTVTANLPGDNYQDEENPTGSVYSILQKNSLQVPLVYLQNGAAATLTSPKEKTTISFADGVATATLGVYFEVDEEGHDALKQYGFKDVVVDICGKPFTFRVHRWD